MQMTYSSPSSSTTPPFVLTLFRSYVKANHRWAELKCTSLLERRYRADKRLCALHRWTRNWFTSWLCQTACCARINMWRTRALRVHVITHPSCWLVNKLLLLPLSLTLGEKASLLMRTPLSRSSEPAVSAPVPRAWSAMSVARRCSR